MKKILREVPRRLRLRHILFLSFLLSGIVPLAISSLLLIQQNRKILEEEEMDHLTRSAEALSREVSEYLAAAKKQLIQLGSGVLVLPGPRDVQERLAQPWVAAYLQNFVVTNSNLVALRVLDSEGVGPRFAPSDLTAAVQVALDTAFEQARSHRRGIYRFVELPPGNEPGVVIAVPVTGPRGELALILEAVARLELMEAIFRREAHGQVGVYLIDRNGDVIWSAGSTPEMDRAVSSSELVRDFIQRPLNLTTEYSVIIDGQRQRILARVSPVAEAEWGVVVQKPVATAFGAVNKMIFNTLLSTVLLVAMALFFALMAARWVGQPIQRLTQTSHEIAAGNFGQRVEVRGLNRELAELAEDFNQMSAYVESYVEQLRRAAQANRDLFIGSIRAFAAAIDAKDPYTRGHSERVAAMSRVISRHLGLSGEVQHKVWVGALLHDVGKIGVEDRILRKGGILSPEEYEQMKAHTVIGAEILSPIEQLREMIPAIRWHHENWNGRGYPDGLKGEEIPLIARIVAVADTFDAVTTTRPYQQAYTLEAAVETITRLTGSRFDAKVVTAFLRAVEMGDIQIEAGRQERVLATA